MVRSVAVCGSHLFPSGGPDPFGGLSVLAVRIAGDLLKHDPSSEAVSEDPDALPVFYQQQEAGRADEPCGPGYKPDPGLHGGNIRRYVFRIADHDCFSGNDASDQLEDDPYDHGRYCLCLCDYQSILAPYPLHFS